jgi:hypothetical protein
VQPVLSAGGADSPSSTMATLGLAATKSSFGLLTDPAAVSKAIYTVFSFCGFAPTRAQFSAEHLTTNERAGTLIGH